MLILMALGCCPAFATIKSSLESRLTHAQEPAASVHSQALPQITQADSQSAAELDYCRGLALARLGRWNDAQEIFLRGHSRWPRDKRFPTELAGIAFKQKNYPRAAKWLRQALQLDPKDTYANDFLGTVYFVEGNLEAALKHWNRVDKPRIDRVQTGSRLRVRPSLLDHAFAFAPASMLERDQLLTSEARLDMLQIFPSYRLDLEAKPDNTFDLQFQARENNGFGNGKLQALLGILSGLPYQEVNPDYFNIGGSATNWTSLLRWDAQKRRAQASLSGPFRRNPRWRYRIGTDLREENWELRQSSTGSAPILGGLNLRREAVTAEITRLAGSRWAWTAVAQFSHRDYRDVFAGSALTAKLLTQGNELTETATLRYEVLHIPERRLTVASTFSAEAGRLWSGQGESFTRVRGSLDLRWLPRAQGDDYSTRLRFRAGDTLGQIPFDEMFMLGMERDNDLWLRGHIGTRDGQKGSAPMGTRYVLTNWETDKNLYRNGIITLKLGPFLDSGAIAGASAAINSQEWLWDAGAQAKISVLGIGVTLVYGKDLTSGRNGFYTSVGEAGARGIW